MKKNNGSAPHSGQIDKTALLLVDVISDFEFEDGHRLFENAVPAAKKIADLRRKATTAGLPVIYVNDNFGKWQEDLEKQAERIIESSAMGRKIVEILRPGSDDYYVLKPQRSGFYETPLAVLLASMEITSLIVTGFSTDICVLFTAHDAYMRGFKVHVPSDCSAAVEEGFHRSALELIERVAHADITPSAGLDLDTLAEHKVGARTRISSSTLTADEASV